MSLECNISSLSTVQYTRSYFLSFSFFRLYCVLLIDREKRANEEEEKKRKKTTHNYASLLREKQNQCTCPIGRTVKRKFEKE